MAETHEQLARQVQATYRALIRAINGATIIDWVELDLTLTQIKIPFALADEETATIGGWPSNSKLVNLWPAIWSNISCKWAHCGG